MSTSEIDLLVAVSCIKCICIGDQKSYMFQLSKTTIICLVLQMWVKEAITQLIHKFENKTYGQGLVPT